MILLSILLLAVLEVSLSFDNAVVNASVLKRMPALWQRRFLTWGILVAVFGMRLVLPVLIGDYLKTAFDRRWSVDNSRRGVCNRGPDPSICRVVSYAT